MATLWAMAKLWTLSTEGMRDPNGWTPAEERRLRSASRLLIVQRSRALAISSHQAKHILTPRLFLGVREHFHRLHGADMVACAQCCSPQNSVDAFEEASGHQGSQSADQRVPAPLLPGTRACAASGCYSRNGRSWRPFMYIQGMKLNENTVSWPGFVAAARYFGVCLWAQAAGPSKPVLSNYRSYAGSTHANYMACRRRPLGRVCCWVGVRITGLWPSSRLVDAYL